MSGTFQFELPGLRAAGAPVWLEACDEFVTDTSGERYVDMSMGFGSAIWGHGWVAKEITRRFGAEQMVQGMGDLQAHSLRDAALERLCSFAAAAGWHSSADLRAAIFHTGSEAVETALKTALLEGAPERTRIVAFEGGYHGTFGLALAATHRGAFRDPFASILNLESVSFRPYGEIPELDERTACVIVEPIQGRSGVLMPPPEFVHELRGACDAAGALLIVDSVQVGCGRSGDPLLGVESSPDIVCLGKAVGGGFAASAVVMTREVAAVWSGRGDEAIHTSTHIGHGVACAAILASLAQLDECVLEEACAPIRQAVQALADYVDVRGRGALWALDTGQAGGGVELAARLLERKILAAPSGVHGESLTVTPALNTRVESLERFVEAATTALR